jgi:hypothetical protein
MRKLLASVVKSPYLHFVFLGVMAFILYVHLKPPNREIIQITSQTIDALVQQRESITQNPVTAEERLLIIEGHVEDEVLLREAYKRDFDKNDYRVRKRILNIMRNSLSDVIPEPSVAQLRSYYQENKQRFLTSQSRSFEQVYFSFASTKLPENPENFIEVIKNTSDLSSLGDFSTALGTKFNKASFQSIATTFGKPFAQAVFELPTHQWKGPIESFHGNHYVRVTATHEAELPPFEQMESYLRTDYLLYQSRESQKAKVEELRKNYLVIVEGK